MQDSMHFKTFRQPSVQCVFVRWCVSRTNDAAQYISQQVKIIGVAFGGVGGNVLGRYVGLDVFSDEVFKTGGMHQGGKGRQDAVGCCSCGHFATVAPVFNENGRSQSFVGSLLFCDLFEQCFDEGSTDINHWSSVVFV